MQVSIVREERSNKSHAEKGLENTLWRTQCHRDGRWPGLQRHALPGSRQSLGTPLRAAVCASVLLLSDFGFAVGKAAEDVGRLSKPHPSREIPRIFYFLKFSYVFLRIDKERSIYFLERQS